MAAPMLRTPHQAALDLSRRLDDALHLAGLTTEPSIAARDEIEGLKIVRIRPAALSTDQAGGSTRRPGVVDRHLRSGEGTGRCTPRRRHHRESVACGVRNVGQSDHPAVVLIWSDRTSGEEARSGGTAVSGYQEKPVELPWPYSDLAPEPVSGCPRCAELGQMRYEARKRKESAVAAVSSAMIRNHERGHRV
ncbi:hypothetical protein SSP35_04_04160 [Streptomyces sp. NBRC 110611]|nr:hypothetical protein SSP35_04_04160 [Streptomyces sp. NBRC 110611]